MDTSKTLKSVKSTGHLSEHSTLGWFNADAPEAKVRRLGNKAALDQLVK